MLKRRPRFLLVLFGVVVLGGAGCDASRGNDDEAGDGSGIEQAARELDAGDGADDVPRGDEADPDTAGIGEPDDTESGHEHADERVVEVYFTSEERGDIEDVFPVERTVPTPDVLHGALDALLVGPTAEEEAAGYAGFFSDETAGMLNGAEIEGRVARVDLDADLRGAIPNAGTSTGALTLLAQLDGQPTGRRASGGAAPRLGELEAGGSTRPFRYLDADLFANIPKKERKKRDVSEMRCSAIIPSLWPLRGGRR